MANCKHGIEQTWCAFCTPPKPKLKKRMVGRVSTDGAAPTTSISSLASGQHPSFVVVRTFPRSTALVSLRQVGPHTRTVHLDGMPFRWVIETIMARAAALERIQIPPGLWRRVTEGLQTLCTAREKPVQLVRAYYRPDLGWYGEGQNRSPHYHTQQLFLKNLEGEQRARFGELLTMGFEQAIVAARYFCLRDEHYIPLYELGQELGLGLVDSSMSERVNAVLRYLDPEFACGEGAISMARVMEQRVQRLRPYVGQAERLAELARELGIPAFPPNLRFAYLETYCQVLRANPRIRETLVSRPRHLQVMILRYGLDDLTHPVYRTLEVVGEIMRLTKERVRQLEAKALELLVVERD